MTINGFAIEWALIGGIIGYLICKHEMDKGRDSFESEAPSIEEIMDAVKEREAQEKEKNILLESDKSILGKLRYKIYRLTKL